MLFLICVYVSAIFFCRQMWSRAETRLEKSLKKMLEKTLEKMVPAAESQEPPKSTVNIKWVYVLPRETPRKRVHPAVQKLAKMIHYSAKDFFSAFSTNFVWQTKKANWLNVANHRVFINIVMRGVFFSTFSCRIWEQLFRIICFIP